MSEPKIRKGLAKSRENLCYQTTRDILIPAGTIAREADPERGGDDYVEIPIGHGKDFRSHVVIKLCPEALASGDFKRVIA